MWFRHKEFKKIPKEKKIIFHNKLHRTHRSKKNRKSTPKYEQIKIYKKRKEKIKEYEQSR